MSALITFEAFLEAQLARMREQQRRDAAWRPPHLNAAEQLARRAAQPAAIVPTPENNWNVIEGDPA
jgi:hypothetical protein